MGSARNKSITLWSSTTKPDEPEVEYTPPPPPAYQGPDATVEAPSDLKEEARIKRMREMHGGSAGTVKTSGRGVIQRAVLMGMMPSGTKTKIGQ